MKYVLLLVMLFLVCWVKAQDPGRYDVVIHEIFADPTPSRGLPAYEFIEIRNRSNTARDLRNWTISNGNTVGRINVSFVLKPDSIVILTGTTGSGQYARYGMSIAVTNFPALDNDGDTLILSSPAGVVHALVWDKDWYESDLKAEGGWSLEMIDRDKPCIGSANWTASKDLLGGTPGRKNSVGATVRDSLAPQLLYGYFKDSINAVLVFSEPLAQRSSWYIKTDPNASFTRSDLLGPLFNELGVQWASPQKQESLISISVDSIIDCAGNRSGRQTTQTGVFSPVGKNDIVVNEILFDPPVGGCDYLELFNRSNKNIDLATLQIANRGSDNKLASITPISASSYPFLPGEYALLSINNPWVFNHFKPPTFQRSLQLRALPSFPDDEGEVVVLDHKGEIIDELNYDEKWHFSLISDPVGISLERISPSGQTNDPSNWHSASTSSGYGTPGYKNSQTLPDQKQDGTITLSSKVISPDMDGREDFLIINYRFPVPGTVAYVTAFDSRGRAVRSIARASLCGTSGSFRWDGTNNGGSPAPAGVYVILTEVFDLQGKTKKYRHTVGLFR